MSSSAQVKQSDEFSYSVRENLRKVIERTYPSGVDLPNLAIALFNIHPEYAKDEFAKFNQLLESFKPTNKENNFRAYDQWLEQVKVYVKQPKGGVIHGRLFITGAILVEFDYYKKLKGLDFIDGCKSFLSKIDEEFRAKYKSSVFESLTDKGKGVWERIFVAPGDLHDLQNRYDLPSDIDLLSRDAIAGYLGKRINHIYLSNRNLEDGSFFIHIDGPWGSGKSTFLKFLKSHVASDEKAFKVPAKTLMDEDGLKEEWIVVEFNAWQNQRLNPPWWFIMEALFKKASSVIKRRKGLFSMLKYKFNHWWWQLNTGSNYGYAALTTFVLFITALVFRITSKTDLDEKIKWGGIISLLGFIWTLTKFIRTSLVSGSARSAREFMETSGKDPMEELSNHFDNLVRCSGYPVAIFIDDLDRCNKDYGIQLMEGLQTIFKRASVVYVVAADRRWLSTMYERNYSDFAAVVEQPGKPFGLVFLDKTFQLVLEIPVISPDDKQRFWNSMLGINDEQKRESIKEAHDKANMILKDCKGNKEKLKMATNHNEDPLIAQALREQAVQQLSIEEEEKYIEHRLQRFLPLIDNNPRSMKRLINTFSIEKALSLVANRDLDDDQLILWIILKLQFPRLADYYLENSIESLLKSDSPLKSIVTLNAVRRIMEYEYDNRKGLQQDFINKMQYQ